MIMTQMDAVMLAENWRLVLYKLGRGRYCIKAYISVERAAGGIIYYAESIAEARAAFKFLAKQDLSVIKACVRASGLKD